MDPLRLVIIIAACVSAFCWIASVVSRDSSWVDRMWSIVPMVYVAVFAAAADFQDLRLNVMAVLVAMWGTRLTFNFARKGGYSGVEDYRWPVVRARMKPWQYQVFNVVFIVLAQNALLVLITLPALTAYENQATTFGPTGVLLAALFLACLAGETVADQQQWRFHAWKRAERKAGRTPDPQFLQTGLFRFSRHPNYFFEQAMWWIVFLFGATAAGSLWQWTALGALLLTLLFIGSTRLTEEITLSKYPEYAQYQARTSMVVPWFPRKPRTAVEAA
jgi:steroid 5-alpha reductase family enzyme